MIQKFIGTVSLIYVAACAQEPTATKTPTVNSDPVVVRSSVDKAVATTGDVITYEVLIEYKPQVTINVPEPGADIAGFRIIDLGVERSQLEDGRNAERRWYKLRADLVGSYVLPSIHITYTDTQAHDPQSAVPPSSVSPGNSDRPPEQDQEGGVAKTAPAESAQSVSTSEIFVEVKSVLPTEGEASDIRGLKPLHRVERRLPWGPIGAGAALCAVGIFLFAWLRRKRQISAIPADPPHEIAFAALNELRQTDFKDPEQLRRYYFSLSEVLRSYVEARFALNATDLTTPEILHRLRDIDEMNTVARRNFTSFLRATDQVKFAGHTPSPQEIATTYDEALSFVEDTREVSDEETDSMNSDQGAITV
ncbi:MAG: hypothetical protein R3C68_06140 [Myxococcota bacterium]